jgi:hypothetical protein
MPKTRRASPATILDPLARQILDNLRVDFLEKNLGSEALQDGYVGASLPLLEQQYCGSGLASKVDFDLAVKQLEDGTLIKTGPMVPFQNKSGSRMLVVAFFSKREYAYLTESGYRAASQQPRPTSRSASRPVVNISGGTFHQSPIGIGDHVAQSVAVNNGELAEGVRKLVDQLERLLPTSGLPASVQENSQTALAELREAAVVSTPDIGRLRQGLESLKHIMEHAAGHLVAAGVLASITELLSHSAH